MSTIIIALLTWIASSAVLCVLMSAKKLRISEQEHALENDEQARRLVAMVSQPEGSAFTA